MFKTIIITYVVITMFVNFIYICMDEGQKGYKAVRAIWFMTTVIPMVVYLLLVAGYGIYMGTFPVWMLVALGITGVFVIAGIIAGVLNMLDNDTV